MSDSATLATEETLAAPVQAGRTGGLWRDAFHDLRRRPSVVVACAVILLLLLMAAFPKLFTSVEYDLCDLKLSKQGPSSGHWFGYDEFGCDYFAMTVYGARPSIVVGVLTTVVVLVIGGFFGALAGYYGGLWDTAISRVVDVFYAVPYVLGAILILAVWRAGGSFWPSIVALSMFGWIGATRLLRASFIEVRHLDYVTAAKSLGAKDRRLMFRHILPNAIAPLMSGVPLMIGGYIEAEASLGFLGLGILPPQISWVMMLNSAMPHVQTDPWLLVIPAMFLLSATVAFAVLGDAMRDALDPKLR